MERELRPAFYSLSAGTWRDYVTLLHPPYTLWHLSYVVLGAAAAPDLDLQRMGSTLGAFFLAVGIGAHALDELQGRPLQTRIPRPVLQALAVLSAMGALGIGIYGIVTVSFWLLAFIAAGIFILFAYNLELLGGRFHSDFWFALSWGVLPFVVAYWASATSFNTGAGLLAATCFGLSMAQRKLSTQVRSIRRRAERVTGQIEYKDGTVEPLGPESLLLAPEAALRALTASVILLATGWLAVRLL